MRHFGFFIRIKGSDGTRPKVKKSSNVGFQFGCIRRGRITRPTPTPTHRKRLKGIEIEIPKHESQGHLFTAAVFSKVLLNLSCLLLLSRKVATPFHLKPAKVFCCFARFYQKFVFFRASHRWKNLLPEGGNPITEKTRLNGYESFALHPWPWSERESVCVGERERERESLDLAANLGK